MVATLEHGKTLKRHDYQVCQGTHLFFKSKIYEEVVSTFDSTVVTFYVWLIRIHEL